MSQADFDDCRWLTGAEAARVLDDVAAADEPPHRVVARLRKTLNAVRAHLVLEQVELRRRAKAKFPRAEEMFFTNVALQQATDVWTARYKASRYHWPQVSDFCCGIGGDLIALGEVSAATAVDLDPIAGLFARINHEVAVGKSSVVLEQSVDEQALTPGVPWHIDPDRRPSGRRTLRLEDHSPALVTLEEMFQIEANGAVKLAPAAAPPDDWATDSELQWISRDGECRQLVVWRGELAEAPGARSAVMLRTPRTIEGSIADTKPCVVVRVVGAPDRAIAESGSVGRYLYDVDPAVVASRITGALAESLGLAAVASGVHYFTNDEFVDHPALSAFEVLEAAPLDLKKMARHLKEAHVGILEIKQRGGEIDPEAVRKQLRLKGENALTLLVWRRGRRRMAALARRVEPNSES